MPSPAKSPIAAYLMLAPLLISLAANLVLIFLLVRQGKTLQTEVETLVASPGNRARIPQADYPFLSPRIFAEKQNDILINFIPLRTALREYLEPQANKIGVYFEYLPSGTSIGINEKEVFYGASLLKLPTAMKAYKLVEEGKLKRDQVIKLEEKHIDRGFGDLWQKGSGTTITLSEAIQTTVAQSDNTAFKALRDVIHNSPVSDVFDYLDIPTDIAEGPGAGITPKNFSSVLWALYLSAYLSHENSNELLQIMTTSPYHDKIAANLPAEIKIAHKIGVFRSQDQSEETHSDCGVIYAPQRPYLLCIMTKSNEAKAREYMQHVSKMIYGYVSAAH